LRRVLSLFRHPFHCWTHSPYVAVSSLSAHYEGNQAAQGGGPAMLDITRFTVRQ